MNFLNQSDLNGKPLVKYIIIGLVVVNAFVLAFLLFGPRIGPSANAPAPSSPDSTDAMTEESMTYEDYNSADSSEAYTSYETPAEAEDEEYGDFEEGSEESEESNEEEGISETGPILELVDDHVTLKVGDYFNFYDYIVTMRDRDGSDLSRYIHLKGEVNTYVPGDYTITYQITSPATGETTSKDLLVTVEQ